MKISRPAFELLHQRDKLLVLRRLGAGQIAPERFIERNADLAHEFKAILIVAM